MSVTPTDKDGEKPLHGGFFICDLLKIFENERRAAEKSLKFRRRMTFDMKQTWTDLVELDLVYAEVSDCKHAVDMTCGSSLCLSLHSLS